MSDALDLWREKLAGVTPGEWYAEGREGYGDIPGVEIIAGDYTALVAIGDVDELDAEANAAHIVRSDRLSRILADEATVEGLARMLCARDQVDPDAMFEGHPVWMQYEDEAWDVLNHLAQLALGDG